MDTEKPARPRDPDAPAAVAAAAAGELPPVAVDPVESAKAAGLRYVSDDRPGIRRKRAGRGFCYLAPDGARVTDAATIARIQALRIPPAWTSVWICPRPDGHIQATGRDARGRKQYRYHARFRAERDDTKYHRMIAFGAALPALRRRVEEDLALPGLPRQKVLAAVVRLLEQTYIRVGNEEYARENASFGLTTLRDEHVEVSGPVLRFSFRGKSGKEQSVDLRDRRLARIVKRCQDLPGEELFQYLDEEGNQRPIHSDDVNAYLREITGQDFTAKDFRTWAGTILAAEELARRGAGRTASETKRNVVRAIEAVAARLGNTRAVCKRCYIHPAILDAYLDGTMLAHAGREVPAGSTFGAPGRLTAPSAPNPAWAALAPHEAPVLALIEARVSWEKTPLETKLRASIEVTARRRPAKPARALRRAA